MDFRGLTCNAEARTLPAVRNIVQRFWHAMLILLSAAPLVIAGESSAVPKRLSAEVQTLGAGYTVELSDGILTCTTFGRRRSNLQRRVIKPSDGEWREFRQTLDDFKVWQWHGTYVDPGITLDGMGWSLDVAYDDYEVKSSGYNAYPDATGEPVGSPYAFRRYQAALKKLT